MTYQRSIPLLAFLSGLPAVAIALVLLWTGEHASRTQWTLSVLVVLVWMGLLVVLRDRLVRPLHAVSNLLAALREGDYSLRTRVPDRADALGLILAEVNALGQSFQEQRLDALEAANLFGRVLAVIDIALFAFDEKDRLRLVNRAGEELLGKPEGDTIGESAESLGLASCLAGQTPRVMDMAFAGGLGRWEIRRRPFRQDGRPHQLVALADLSQVLREEERMAWQRLVRVLSHEINNSLTPIKSIADSLTAILDRADDSDPLHEDLQEGLAVIAGRSAALGRFMASYARLAKLPRPDRKEIRVEDWVNRVVSLETRRPVEVVGGPSVMIRADGDQLDQALINLIENGVDAALETGGSVSVGWSASAAFLDLYVQDEGPGLAQTTNLFVPFFTTKPKGSGIGLALSRQIAEAHGGTLALENRTDRSGCIARICLPLD